MTEQLPAFERPRNPEDRWMADLLAEHGLPENASLAQVEAKATELLSDTKTALTGAELVLGRRVDGNVEKEPDVIPIIGMPELDGKTRFGLLLMQSEIEKAQKQGTAGLNK